MKPQERTICSPGGRAPAAALEFGAQKRQARRAQARTGPRGQRLRNKSRNNKYISARPPAGPVIRSSPLGCLRAHDRAAAYAAGSRVRAKLCLAAGERDAPADGREGRARGSSGRRAHGSKPAPCAPNGTRSICTRGRRAPRVMKTPSEARSRLIAPTTRAPPSRPVPDCATHSTGCGRADELLFRAGQLAAEDEWRREGPARERARATNELSAARGRRPAWRAYLSPRQARPRSIWRAAYGAHSLIN